MCHCLVVGEGFQKKEKETELKVMSAPKEGFVFSGKDARLYVFKLRALRRGLEEKQLVRSKCDSRENKLEKTKGEVLAVADFTNESQQIRKAGDVCMDFSLLQECKISIIDCV